MVNALLAVDVTPFSESVTGAIPLAVELEGSTVTFWLLADSARLDSTAPSVTSFSSILSEHDKHEGRSLCWSVGPVVLQEKVGGCFLFYFRRVTFHLIPRVPEHN